MGKITFLGPVGATFSHDAYNVLAEIYGTPAVEPTNCLPANSNGEILKLVLQHGGYGAIAMETLAEGRVAEPLESFIDLMKSFPQTEKCPIRIIGAIRLEIHFCLMVRSEVSTSTPTRIIAHPKALGACKRHIAENAFETITAPSNGEAARLVAESAEYKDCVALGPRSAAKKYGLQILNEAFEDAKAVTTFFLIAPAQHQISTGTENRILLVFRVPHEPGALVKSLQPFGQERLNLIQIHSVHTGNQTYDFAVEIEVKHNELEAMERATRAFKEYVEAHLCFGPFEVLSR